MCTIYDTYGRLRTKWWPIWTLKNFFNLGYKVSLAGSSYINGTRIIENKGYQSNLIVKSDGEVRKIFKDLKNEDALDLICSKGGIRTVLLK